MRKTFLALRNRNFRLFFVGQLISNTGNWLTNVALTLLVLKITGSGLDVGILAGFQFGPICGCRRGRGRSPTAPTSAGSCS
jgi:hypothetical protein